MPVASTPSNSTRPAVENSKPPRMRNSVVWPDLDGPSRATSAPEGIASDTGCSAAVVPNSLVISSISMRMSGLLKRDGNLLNRYVGPKPEFSKIPVRFL